MILPPLRSARSVEISRPGVSSVEAGPLRDSEQRPRSAMSQVKPRILLVEDDRTIAEMYAQRLEMQDWDIRVAADGAAAVDAALSTMPDLIVLDIELPIKNGIEVLRELRARPPTMAIPVVVLSNTPGAMSMDVAHQLGISAWAVKSATTPDQLAGLVSVYLPDIGVNPG
jgi:CheY-like chemotaxis protein